MEVNLSLSLSLSFSLSLMVTCCFLKLQSMHVRQSLLLHKTPWTTIKVTWDLALCLHCGVGKGILFLLFLLYPRDLLPSLGPHKDLQYLTHSAPTPSLSHTHTRIVSISFFHTHTHHTLSHVVSDMINKLYVLLQLCSEKGKSDKISFIVTQIAWPLFVFTF